MKARHGRSDRTSEPLSRFAKATVVLEALLSVGALGGGSVLMIAPRGEIMPLIQHDCPGRRRPAARDQALHPQAATRSGDTSEAERAPEPRGESKLTLVSAPAGFGKTTLLAEWLAATPCRRTVARRGSRSTPATTRPRSFWPYVIAALQTVAPEVGATALSLLQSPQPPPIEIGPRHAAQRAQRGCRSDIVLVLDDYHVIDARDIQDGMAFLLEHLPPQLHLVIATRADPALPLARLRARGELVEIRAADLRFTPDEAAAYLNEVMGLELTARDVAALEGRTEGWIAALQLAALSMQGRDDVAGFIAGFAGDDRYIVDYLVEEVLQRQPEQVRQLPAADLDPGPADWPAVRCRHRPGGRQGDAGGARSREPVPRPARRPPPLVSLPPALCRRAARAPLRRAARRGCPTCTGGPATGTSTTATAPRRSGTRWPARTSSERPA